MVFRKKPNICSQCGLEGKHHSHVVETFREKERSKTRTLTPKIDFLTLLPRNRLIKKFSCPFCLDPLILGTCQTCGARTYVTCPHCNGFLSETTKICPTCKKRIQPLINIQINAFTRAETIILGVSLLASIAFLLAPLNILVLSGSSSFSYSPLLVFYFVMSLTVLSNVIIALFFNQPAGMQVLYCFFLELTLLGFVILGGAMVTGILRGVLFFDLIGVLILVIGMGVLSIVASRYYNVFHKNYSPIFPEYRTKTKIEGFEYEKNSF
jgi:hypothetical protein